MTRTADDYSPAELVAAAAAMDRVLKCEPLLGDFGFGMYAPRRKAPEQRAAELYRDRESIREPRSLAQFLAARGWLRQFDKIKTSQPPWFELRLEARGRGRHRLHDQWRFYRRRYCRRLHCSPH